MIMMNLVFKVVMDAFILAFGISAAHFLVIGSAIGKAGFIGIFPFCLLFDWPKSKNDWPNVMEESEKELTNETFESIILEAV